MVIAALRSGTADLHRRVERQLEFLVRAPQLEAYVGVLRGFFGYYPAIEDELAALAGCLPPALGLEARRKSGHLARDLIALGADESALREVPRCPETPSLLDPARALGCMYVLEGATLGGRIIARVTGPSLGLDASRGGSFFHSYGEHVDAMWASFLGVLDATCADAGSIDGAVGAARETFATLGRWLERGPLP